MELYSALKDVWAAKAREARLAGLRQKAIDKGFRPTEKPKAVRTAKTATTKATSGKLTKNAIFCQAVKDNPGITMNETCDYTGSHDKHYNLLKTLIAAGQMQYGPARNGSRAQGLYWIG